MNKLSTPKIKTGVYRHYKGNQYKVLGVALHSETLEPLVIYEPLYKSEVKHWVRPLTMFTELVDIDGDRVPRFRKVN